MMLLGSSYGGLGDCFTFARYGVPVPRDSCVVAIGGLEGSYAVTRWLGCSMWLLGNY